MRREKQLIALFAGSREREREKQDARRCGQPSAIERLAACMLALQKNEVSMNTQTHR